MTNTLIKSNTEIRQLLKVAVAILLSVSVLSQSGIVSVTKLSCFSCFDKAWMVEVESCCAPKVKSQTDSNLCCSGEPCCDSQEVEQVFFTVSNKVEYIPFQSVLSKGLSSEDIFGLLARFRLPFRYTHSKAPPLNGRIILQLICKYTL